MGVAAGFLMWRDGATGTRGAVDDVMVESARVGEGPFAAIGQFFDRVGDSWNAAAKVEALEKENQQLRQWREQALMLSERMDRYEALLKMPKEAFGAGIDSAGIVSARLVLDVASPFKRTLLANAGADHGVKEGYIVVNENGLVGRVVTVGQRSSRVLLLDDYNARVPVMGIQSRMRAMLSGDASDTPSLETGRVDVAPARLDHRVVGVDNPLRVGERIVTSGDGGLYPRGLLVGFAMHDGEGAWRVDLAISKSAIDFVRIIPFAPLAPPETALIDDEGPRMAPSAVAAAAQVPTSVGLSPTALAATRQPTRPAPPRDANASEDDAAPPVPDATPPPAVAPAPLTGPPPSTTPPT
jgi:rod shape-determining protein MreC